MNSFFVHWTDSSCLTPYSSYLKEVGVMKFSHIELKSHKMHYNDGIEINYVIGGTYRWNCGGHDYQLFPGEVFVTCPWQRHGSPDEILDRGILSWLILKPEKFSEKGFLELGSWSSLKPDTQKEIGRLLAGNTNPVLPRGTDIIRIFRQLNEELISENTGKDERIHMLLDSLLLIVGRAIGHRNEKTERDSVFLERLVRTMEQCFENPMSMPALAYKFDMSPTTFNNRVKSLTGLPPADFLINLKISHARRLLQDSNATITEIAHSLGFYSSQHFSTQFSRRTGMSPSSFRKLGNS